LPIAKAKWLVVENVISLFIHALTSLHCAPFFGGVLHADKGIGLHVWGQGKQLC